MSYAISEINRNPFMFKAIGRRLFMKTAACSLGAAGIASPLPAAGIMGRWKPRVAIVGDDKVRTRPMCASVIEAGGEVTMLPDELTILRLGQVTEFFTSENVDVLVISSDNASWIDDLTWLSDTVAAGLRGVILQGFHLEDLAVRRKLARALGDNGIGCVICELTDQGQIADHSQQITEQLGSIVEARVMAVGNSTDASSTAIDGLITNNALGDATTFSSSRCYVQPDPVDASSSTCSLTKAPEIIQLLGRTESGAVRSIVASLSSESSSSHRVATSLQTTVVIEGTRGVLEFQNSSFGYHARRLCLARWQPHRATDWIAVGEEPVMLEAPFVRPIKRIFSAMKGNECDPDDLSRVVAAADQLRKIVG